MLQIKMNQIIIITENVKRTENVQLVCIVLQKSKRQYGKTIQ